MQQAFQTNAPAYVEQKTKFTNHREVWLGTWLVPIDAKNGEPRAVMSISRDISEHKEVDRLRDEFIAMAAHELKTPLAIIKGYAQAMLRTPAGMPGSCRKMLEAINRGSDRMDAVVRDLLDISKITAGVVDLANRPVDLNALVSKCSERVSSIDDKHRFLTVSDAPAVVNGDPDRLEQVLMQLLANAIKYSPAGGDIEVAVAISDH